MNHTLTQKGRILQLLKSRGTSGVKVYELIAPRPEGLGIAQYNARIKELRESGYQIINVSPGHFVLNNGFESNNQTSNSNFDPMFKENWAKMGAFLRGEGPKPEKKQGLEYAIQEVLL